MTQLININFLAMTSKEIAELCDKNINHVNRDIKVMLEQLDDHYPNLDSMYKTVTYKQKVGFGERDNVMYYLNKELTLILISGYNVKIRQAIIRRWQELEAKSNLTVFNQDTSTHRGALLALVASLDKIEADKPKVAYFDNLVERNLLINIRDSAKELNVKQNTFVKWLLDNKYVYRDAKEQLKPYAVHTPSLFELKEYINPNNGQSGNQLLTTPRGRETFNLLLNGVK